MQVEKLLKSGHPYFCDESRQLYLKMGRKYGFRSFTEYLNVFKSLKPEEVGLTPEVYESWISRTKHILSNYELLQIGGDLRATDRYRLKNTTHRFVGSLEECQGFIRKNNLRDAYLERLWEDKVENVKIWHMV